MKKFLIQLKYAALKSLDISFSLFMVTPILVGNFFSLWNIFDSLLATAAASAGGIQEKIISFVAGVCGQFALLFYQDVLAKIFQSNGIILVLMSRVLLVISSVVNICFWRAIWNAYDSICSAPVDDDNSILMNIVQNSVILMALRVYRNAIAAPFVILTDHDNNNNSNLFQSKTFLRKSVSRERPITPSPLPTTNNFIFKAFRWKFNLLFGLHFNNFHSHNCGVGVARCLGAVRS